MPDIDPDSIPILDDIINHKQVDAQDIDKDKDRHEPQLFDDEHGLDNDLVEDEVTTSASVLYTPGSLPLTGSAEEDPSAAKTTEGSTDDNILFEAPMHSFEDAINHPSNENTASDSTGETLEPMEKINNAESDFLSLMPEVEARTDTFIEDEEDIFESAIIRLDDEELETGSDTAYTETIGTIIDTQQTEDTTAEIITADINEAVPENALAPADPGGNPDHGHEPNHKPGDTPVPRAVDINAVTESVVESLLPEMESLLRVMVRQTLEEKLPDSVISPESYTENHAKSDE